MTIEKQKTLSTAIPLKRFLISIVRWFDTHAGIDPNTGANSLHGATKEKSPDWVRNMPFFTMHLMCLGVIWVGWSWPAVAVCAAMYFIRMFAITGFYHRYFSHKTFKTSRAIQFFFAVIGNSAVQKGPLWWAAHHRHHHKYSDQEEDIHSPHQHGIWWSHIGWVTSSKNFATNIKLVPDLAKFPELVFLNRFDTLIPLLLGFLMYYFGRGLEGLGVATTGMQMLIWGFFVSTIFLFHGTCTINSFCHIIGRPRYKTSDKSKNSFLLAMITLGEGWHNNHHHYMSSTRQGFFWWEIDITFYLLKCLSWVGVVWDLKPVPKRILSTDLLES